MNKKNNKIFHSDIKSFFTFFAFLLIILCNISCGSSDKSKGGSSKSDKLEKSYAGVPTEYCEELVRLAGEGNLEAQYRLARAYDDRTYDDLAEFWYQKAAKKAEDGDQWAQLCKGNCYKNGYGVEINLDEAKKWYLKAAKQGNSRAELLIALVTEDEKEESDYLQKAAEHGDSEAMFNMAIPEAQNGNMDKAFEWIKKSAEFGNDLACIALLHFPEKYKKQSMGLLRKLSDQGESTAMIALAEWIYKENFDEANELVRKSADLGNPKALMMLADANHVTEPGYDASKEQKGKWTLQAAKLGYADAQLSMGRNYEDGGDGFQQDKELAYYWFCKAAAQGDNFAIMGLNRLCYGENKYPENEFSGSKTKWTNIFE